MQHYPDISYDFLHYTDSNGMVKDYIVAPDGSCSVECVVNIGDNTKKMFLAVTDYNNKAIKNPRLSNRAQAEIFRFPRFLRFLRFLETSMSS